MTAQKFRVYILAVALVVTAAFEKCCKDRYDKANEYKKASQYKIKNKVASR